MLNLNGHTFLNWREYFTSIFASSNKYQRVDKGIKGHTLIDNYIPIDKNDKTIIIVGFLEDTLIYVQYDNPLTAGFSKQQEAEFFYQYDFTPSEVQGAPGLEFNQTNLQAINKQLEQGLRGKEIQYYKNDKLIKSELLLFYYNKEESYPLTHYFTERPLLSRLINFIFKRSDKEIYDKKEIDLSTVFCGLRVNLK